MMRGIVARSFAPISAFMLGGALLAGGVLGVAAQDNPTPPTETVITHPSHVHKGTCTELDPNPAYPLNDVGPRTNDDGELPASEDIMGSLTAAPVMVSKGSIEVNLDDLLSEAHAINVHESSQNIQNYIACGDLGGAIIDDELVISLQPLNDSGYSGIAILKKDDDNTEVTVYLSQSGTPATVEGTEETPEATPTA